MISITKLIDKIENKQLELLKLETDKNDLLSFKQYVNVRENLIIERDNLIKELNKLGYYFDFKNFEIKLK